MKKRNIEQLQNLLSDLNIERNLLEDKKLFVLVFTLFAELYLVWNFDPAGVIAGIFILLIYETVSLLYLTKRIKSIHWRIMFVSEHGHRIEPQKFAQAKELQLIFQLPDRARYSILAFQRLQLRAI